MKRLYLASFEGLSGIARYSKDFYECVLQRAGYDHLDSSKPLEEIISAISSSDSVHIETGLNQRREAEVLCHLVRRGHPNVDVTVHDPPFAQFPRFAFGSPLLNKASKAFHFYLNNLGIDQDPLGRVRRILVLSERGKALLQARLGIGRRVFHIPLIVRQTEVLPCLESSRDLMFFGFIGKNKGLEYALQLHEALVADFPESMFYVAGTTLNEVGERHLEYLKGRFARNVSYLGFVPYDDLTAALQKAAVVLLPFQPYRFVCPTSASILRCLGMGKAVFTTDVNAVSELIRPGDNGFFLSLNFARDLQLIRSVLSNGELMRRVRQSAIDYVKKEHDPELVRRRFGMLPG